MIIKYFRRKIATSPLRSARAMERVGLWQSYPPEENDELIERTSSVQIVQKVFAIRKGISSAGTPYKKGDPILRLTSTRCTGETYYLTQSDIDLFQRLKPQKQPTISKIVGIFHKNTGV